MQDDYFKATGLPVNVVTPPSKGENKFDYASIAGQKKLQALADAIDANPWIEKDSLSFWYPSFKEWIHECGLVETYDAGPLKGTSCVKRDCWYNASAIVKTWPEYWVMHPYCSNAKELRDEGGNNVEDSQGRDTYGPDDVKYVVDSKGDKMIDGDPIENAYIPPDKFWKWLDQFLADAPLGAIYGSEVVWHNNATVRTPAMIDEGIKATRIRANYKASDKADEQVASMRTLRESVQSADVGNSFPYMFMYLYYEQYAIIVTEALLNLGLALLAVFIITFIMLANVQSSFLVMLCVVLVDIDILGLMYLWGLSIDSVAIINLVLAIGLAVDYSVHVAHAFVQTPGTHQERVDHALLEMGTAVVHGAFSTFLAVLILSVSKSYIFRIFFKQFFGICVFGAAHALPAASAPLPHRPCLRRDGRAQRPELVDEQSCRYRHCPSRSSQTRRRALRLHRLARGIYTPAKSHSCRADPAPRSHHPLAPPIVPCPRAHTVVRGQRDDVRRRRARPCADADDDGRGRQGLAVAPAVAARLGQRRPPGGVAKVARVDGGAWGRRPTSSREDSRWTAGLRTS